MTQMRQQMILSLLIYLVAVMIAINLIIMYVLLKNTPLAVKGEYDLLSLPSKTTINFENKKIDESPAADDIKSLRFRAQMNGEVQLVGPEALKGSEMYQILKKIEEIYNKNHHSSSSLINSYSYSTDSTNQVPLMKTINKRNNYRILSKNNQSIYIGKKVSAIRHRFGRLLNSIQNGLIISVTEDVKMGTQLKLKLKLQLEDKIPSLFEAGDGTFEALFKPNWFPNYSSSLFGVIENGSEVFKGKDRSRGEISAFYLSIIFEVFESLVPISIGRSIHLKREIEPLLKNDDPLSKTFYYSRESKSTCFYGNCFYCSDRESICSDERGTLEGALILLRTDLNYNWKQFINPWRRIYLNRGNSSIINNNNDQQQQQYAEWQSRNICTKFLKYNNSSTPLNSTKTQMNDNLLLDIISTSVFDFLIGNGDRHHLEILNAPPEVQERILLFDNGKSFGNPYEDYIDILSPVIQCCKLRKNLRDKLEEFSGSPGLFTEFFLKVTNSLERLSPLLNDVHLNAIERRITIVNIAFEVCQKDNVNLLK